MIASQVKTLFGFTQFAVLAAAGSACAVTEKVHVTDQGANTVSVIDTASFPKIGSIAVAVPIQLQAKPDNRLLLVANQGPLKKPGTTVSVIDVTGMRVVATIKTGAGAHGVVDDREGRDAFVTDTYANTVSVSDLADSKVVATVPVGKGPNGISMAP